jgi:hypothetical protein
LADTVTVTGATDGCFEARAVTRVCDNVWYVVPGKRHSGHKQYGCTLIAFFIVAAFFMLAEIVIKAFFIKIALFGKTVIELS